MRESTPLTAALSPKTEMSEGAGLPDLFSHCEGEDGFRKEYQPNPNRDWGGKHLEPFVLRDVITILALSLCVLLFCHRAKIPTIVGFLFTGILSGPHGMRAVSSLHEIELVAEIGVVLLLFTIGAELSFSTLGQLRRFVFFGGFLQVSLTFVGIYVLASSFGWPPSESMFVGFLVTMSSTALVLKLLQEKGEVDSLHGKAVIGALVFQDIASVPAMLIIPNLNEGILMGSEVIEALLRGVAIVAVVFAFASLIIPRLLRVIVSFQDSELFVVSAVVICFSVAFLTREAGLSLPLGALLSGLILSQSEYSGVVLSHILPFQQLFTILFFVSIGMLLDVEFLLTAWQEVATLTAVLIVVKAAVCFPVGLALGVSARVSFLTAIYLSQIGELSFVLARVAVTHEVMSQRTYQLLLAVAVLSLLISPLLIALAGRFAALLDHQHLPAIIERGWRGERAKEPPPLQGHLIIIGYGTSGSVVGAAAEAAKVPYIAIELDPKRMDDRGQRKRIIYGDGTYETQLVESGVERARAAVVTLPDPVSARRVVSLLRVLNPTLFILVRARTMGEVNPLTEMGANEVVVEKFEAGMRVGQSFLKEFGARNETINRFQRSVRTQEYEKLRQVLGIE